MKAILFFILFFVSLLSCAPIQLEYDIETQSTVQIPSLEEGKNSLTEIKLEEEPERDHSIDYGFNFIQKLSNTIYENSSCSCGNNNDCSRGCSKQAGNCRGSKAISQSTKYCMRHITGSIMHTIDQYCRKMNIDIPRDQCLEDIEKIKKDNKGKYNICRQSLFYPSALCTLNLDGQDRISFQTISSRVVRNNCRYYNSFNANLRYFYAKLNGELQKLPIFIEIPLQSPEALPFGSLIVLKSSNPNGHVEIKTNKKLCKGSYCFLQ